MFVHKDILPRVAKYLKDNKQNNLQWREIIAKSFTLPRQEDKVTNSVNTAT